MLAQCWCWCSCSISNQKITIWFDSIRLRFWPKWQWLIVHVIDCNFFFLSLLQNQFLLTYKKRAAATLSFLMIRAWQFIIFTIHFSANSLRLTKRLICNQFIIKADDHLIINFDKSKVCNFSCQLFLENGQWQAKITGLVLQSVW